MLLVIQKNVYKFLKLKILIKKLMSQDSKDYKFCINVAINNAKSRINLLEKKDRECIIEEYKEWIKDGFNYQSVLLLREDPII